MPGYLVSWQLTYRIPLWYHDLGLDLSKQGSPFSHKACVCANGYRYGSGQRPTPSRAYILLLSPDLSGTAYELA